MQEERPLIPDDPNNSADHRSADPPPARSIESLIRDMRREARHQQEPLRVILKRMANLLETVHGKGAEH